MAPPLVLPVASGDVTMNTWSTGGTTGSPVTVPVPPNLKDGDTVTILGLDQVAGSSLTISGFTARYHTTTSGTRGFYLYTRKVTNAAADLAGVNYQITQSNSGRGGAIATRCPILSAGPIDSVPTLPDVYNAAVSSTIAVPGVTVGHPDAAVLVCWFANGTSGAIATGTAPGYSVVGQTSVNPAGSTSCLGILQGNPGSGATGTITVTLSAAMASSGGFAISLLPDPAPVGIASGEAFGTPTVSVAGVAPGPQTISPTGIASGEAFGTAAVLAPTWADRFLAQTTPCVAHRNGCWGTYGEETLAGYAFAAAWSSALAFEASVWLTTDLVWVLSHDKTTGRVFSGADLDITASTWAQLSGKTTLVGGRPIARLDALLAAQATGSRVFLVDNKGQQANSTLLDLLDSYGGPARFIPKGYIGSTSWADAAAARGYTHRWGYGYQTDVTRSADSVVGGTPNAFSTNQGHWTMLGMDQAASSASWTYALSFGKLIISDELATAAQKANALSLGATGIMASDITQTVPQTGAVVTPSGIPSAEAFGTPTVLAPQKVSPAGIPSAEAFGTPAVATGGGAQTVAPVGIASGEAFGAPLVSVAGAAPSGGTTVKFYRRDASGNAVLQVVARRRADGVAVVQVPSRR